MGCSICTTTSLHTPTAGEGVRERHSFDALGCSLCYLYPGCQRFSKRRGEVVKREKIEKTWDNLWLPAIVDWSYCANRFELGSRSDPASWLEEPYRCVVIGCLIDSYRSMIVRFASRVTRGFLSPLLCLSLDILFAVKENVWDQGMLFIETKNSFCKVNIQTWCTVLQKN